MVKVTNALLSLAALTSVVATDYPPAQPTFDAKTYTTWERRGVANSKRGQVYVPFTADDGSSDYLSIFRLDLVGNDKERGYAHGYLMARGK
jgi:hypothetical protein